MKEELPNKRYQYAYQVIRLSSNLDYHEYSNNYYSQSHGSHSSECCSCGVGPIGKVIVIFLFVSLLLIVLAGYSRTGTSFSKHNKNVYLGGKTR